MIVLAFFAAAAMIAFSTYLWTGLDAVAMVGALCAFATVGCFLWGLYDPCGPHAWRRNGRDEYTLW